MSHLVLPPSSPPIGLTPELPYPHVPMFPSPAFQYKGPGVIAVPPVHIMTSKDAGSKTDTGSPPTLKEEEQREKDKQIFSPSEGKENQSTPAQSLTFYIRYLMFH